jgi:hypothetical protein
MAPPILSGVAIEPALRLIEPGKCWWCGDPADSREHKLKRSDLVREFGGPPYHGNRELRHVSQRGSRGMHGPNSGRLKFSQSMCARCNDTRSQAFDTAWDSFTQFLVDNEPTVLATREADLRSVFGEDWKARSAGVARYLVKHLICRIVSDLPGPIRLDADLFGFLDGGDFPGSLQIDTCLDLGVVAMLNLFRAAENEYPAAAAGGFLNITPVWAELDEHRCWHTPQSGMHYRWLAVYWRVGDGGPRNPFSHRRVTLNTSDELFGPEVRETFELQAALPPEIFHNVEDGESVQERVRAAGYGEVADRLQDLAERFNRQSDSGPTVKARRARRLRRRTRVAARSSSLARGQTGLVQPDQH